MTDKPGITLVCCGVLGTLVADDGLIERSFAEAIATQGVVSGTSAYARRMAQVHRLRGQGPGDVLGALFPDNEARAQAAQLAFDRALFDAVRRAEIRAIPGVPEVLEGLAAVGCKTGIVTALPRRILDLVLDSAGWRGKFDVALCAEDVARGLPAPDLPLTAMLRAGSADVREVAVVHGTGAGMESGRRAGAGLVAGVLTGPHSPARLREAGAMHVLPSIADLPDILATYGQDRAEEGNAATPPARRAAERGGAAFGTARRPPGRQPGAGVPHQVTVESRTSGR
ncbi:MAG: HAD family hydrolase [Streptosporangiaceae bacterium]